MPYYNSSRAASVRPYGVLVVRSSLLAKWLREWVIRDRVRVRAGARECNTSIFFSLVLIKSVVNIFVFVGSVTSYE